MKVAHAFCRDNHVQRPGLMTTKPEVTARSSVLRGVVSRSPPAHNQPQHHLANEREAAAASESSTSPVTISAILSWRGGSATGQSESHFKDRGRTILVFS